MEENCSPPAIDQYAEKYQLTLVSVSNIIGVPGLKHNMVYDPAQVDRMADRVIDLGIENFKKRNGQIKATIDGIFAVAYGTYTHLSPVPFMTGAPNLVKLLTEDVENLTGGKVALGDDPKEVADGIESHILAKRKGLGLQ